MRLSAVKDLSGFNKLTEEEKALFIDQRHYDIEVINGLINDRVIYRRVVKALSDQLTKNGLVPCTDYDKMIDKRGTKNKSL